MQSPYSFHLVAANRVCRYPKGSIGKGFLLSACSSLTLVRHANFDWAGCPTTRPSIIGYFTIF